LSCVSQSQMEPPLSPFVPSASFPCPCGLTREELSTNRLVGPGGICTAFYLDQIGRICGYPLGAHLHSHAPGENLIVKYNLLFLTKLY
jgi:hypothetical protein